MKINTKKFQKSESNKYSLLKETGKNGEGVDEEWIDIWLITLYTDIYYIYLPGDSLFELHDLFVYVFKATWPPLRLENLKRVSIKV